jgi:1-acyl-sn-glycerol-3-phosphate acyltransferase
MNSTSQNGTRAAPGSNATNSSSERACRTLPRVWRPLASWFTCYSRRYLGKHFNSLNVSRSSRLPTATRMPVVLYANHAAWWDPLVGIILTAEYFPNHTLFAPVEATALRRYKILSKIGFFGVERESRRGVIEYIKTAEAILDHSEHLLAITPQGRFADVRERPVQFQRGLGLLATRVQRALFVPIAIEYTFWEQRLAEILCRFGEPTEVCAKDSLGLNAWHWTAVLERRLEITQDALGEEVCRRNPDNFENLLRRRSNEKKTHAQ